MIELNHFEPHEFECPCGKCDKGADDMDPGFLERLDDARHAAGIVFFITSGMRCREHNRAVGGKQDSSHLVGHAVDIAAPTARQRFKIVEALLEAGFDRIGVDGSFVHVDDDPLKDEEVMWTY